MKFVDRMLARFGLRRAGARASFAGAEVSRLTLDWIVSLLSADKEVRKDMRRLRERGRDLAKNNAFIQQFLGLLTANVIGPRGVRMQAQVRNNDENLNKAINDKIEAAWAEWSDVATVDGEQSLIEFQHLLLATIAADGEAFVRKVTGFPHNKFGFALQLIDADLIDHEFNQPAGDGKPEIRLGIELDQWGRRLAYWAWDKHPNDDHAQARQRIRYPAQEILHLYLRKRPNQTRGYTWFNPIMMAVRMLDGYTEAELVAARSAAAKMGWIVNKEGPAPDSAPQDGKNPLQMEASPGTIEELPAGFEFQSWDPQHPTAAFPDFIKAILRTISTGLRTSYNSLANDLEGVNYSSIKFGAANERDQWKVLQRWWIDRFLKKVYPDFLRAALYSNALVLDSRDFSKFLSIKWQPRGWVFIDPLKDGQAATHAIDNRLDSRSNILGEQGTDYEDVLEQLAEEDRLAKQYGVSTVAPQREPLKPDDEKENDDSTPKKAALRAIG